MRILFTAVDPRSARGCGPLIVDTDPEVLDVEVVEYLPGEPSSFDRFQDTPLDPGVGPIRGSWRAVDGELEDARHDLICPRCWSSRPSLDPGVGVTVRVLDQCPAYAQCIGCDPEAP